MLITRVELENIKSYRHLTVDFRRGTTAISGANGSGKTTLVEAIGFALFDSLPYTQGQFVREGEKYGHVIVHFMGNDDRPYTVERRCGAGSRWFVYDCEADHRIEQNTDVRDKLHDLFGIERERPLDTLFEDALGVPQGAFTSIFLQTASVRKKTFDALLQIEDYKTAADYLLDVQKLYKEKAQAQQLEIGRLTYETHELETWYVSLNQARKQDREYKEQNVLWTQQLVQREERLTALKQQRERLQQLQHRREQCRDRDKDTQQRLQDHLDALNLARTAHKTVLESSADYQRYQRTDALLKQFRQDEKQRNQLRQSQAGLRSNLATIEANVANLQARLHDVAMARQQVIDLSPLVEQQYELEKQRDELARQAMRHESLVKECKQLAAQRAKHLQQQETLQQHIAAIEPLEPVAALLNERLETLASLRAQANGRSSRRQQLREKQEQLKDKRSEREQTAARLRTAESQIAAIEEHRREAEKLPALQEQYEQFFSQQQRLEGNIAGYKKWRKQSAAGQCPLLNETCLNIKQKGLISLESYFDGQLEEEYAQLSNITRQFTLVKSRVDEIKPYAEELGKLGQHVGQRDGLADHLRRLALEINRLEREESSLVQELEALKNIDQQIVQAEKSHAQSKEADQQVRELGSLHKQLQQLQEQIQQATTDLQERQQEVQALSGVAGQLVNVKAQLEVLDDPRSRSKAQQEIIKQEPAYLQQLQVEQQEQQKKEQRLQSLEQQLENYASLDTTIVEQESILQQSQAGYQAYLQNEQAARLLPEREQAYQHTHVRAGEVRQALQLAEQECQKAEAAFRLEELEAVDKQVNQLHMDLGQLAEAMKGLQDRINNLEQQIQKAETQLVELEAAQQEKRTLEELQVMTELFRKLIKEAAPQVLKAVLNDISAEANRIFGEIMGDRSAQLSWQNDYEIVLRRGGISRSFAQLSGGEQMSAALSVRLALLKKLSNLNIAFFDEPTQNMDELRRMNLAEQIRRVRGFDQLIVISHDDTFEQGLDSLVRLRKIDGETRQLTGDEAIQEEREQARPHAS
jgi:DNA repair protein SbcC/Rad50